MSLEVSGGDSALQAVEEDGLIHTCARQGERGSMRCRDEI
jgi:hypothetical protein